MELASQTVVLYRTVGNNKFADQIVWMSKLVILCRGTDWSAPFVVYIQQNMFLPMWHTWPLSWENLILGFLTRLGWNQPAQLQRLVDNWYLHVVSLTTILNRWWNINSAEQTAHLRRLVYTSIVPMQQNQLLCNKFITLLSWFSILYILLNL